MSGMKELVTRATMKRAQRGLFHGVQLGSGNYICFSNKKWNRWFKPNVVKKHLHSEMLNKTYKMNITTRALRTIEKEGGLDQYLLNFSDAKIDSRVGSAIKSHLEYILKKKHEQKLYERSVRRAAERELAQSKAPSS
eukprot:TRINITY_DN615_c0_g1_i1.p1 TRINITY_DN615_c0_g1~~TRINITY_DN615_c0_g1_i1.p1  ORF type:complete len:137 (-),score=15.89 TRINITY_DN615_c0_g1_i1:245-655(-)